MNMRVTLLLLLAAGLLLGIGLAVAADDHASLMGSWQLDSSKSQFGGASVKSEILSLAEAADALQLSESVVADNGKEEKIAYSCAASGQACKAKHGDQVTFYYNGPLLVMIETRHGGDWVVKRRIQASGDGKTLTVEVQRLAPPNQKNDNLVFVRQ
jgi:hypothetical protein